MTMHQMIRRRCSKGRQGSFKKTSGFQGGSYIENGNIPEFNDFLPFVVLCFKGGIFLVLSNETNQMFVIDSPWMKLELDAKL